MISKEEIKKEEWYRQGAELCPWYIFFAFDAAMTVFGEENAIMFSKGHHNLGYWRVSALHTLAWKILEEQVRTGRYMDDMIARWRQNNEKFTKIYLEQEHILGLPDSELVAFLKQLYDDLVEYWSDGVKIEVFDPFGDTIIAECIQKYERSGISLNECLELCALEQPSIAQAAQLSLQKIQVVDETKREALLKEHLWTFRTLNTNFFESKLVDENEVHEQLKGAIAVDLSHLETIKRHKKELKAKYSPSTAMQRVIDFFEKMTAWREERKLEAMRMVYFLARIAEEIARRVKKEPLLVSQALLNETGQLFENDGAFWQELQARQSYFCGLREQGELRILSGDEAKKYYAAFTTMGADSEISELKGAAASSGKAKGPARILLGEKDFPKFQDGDVLVTPMTRPEFVPIMKRAAAIVTEEGGITCHAAIMSRELGKPCVIGVQNAISILKDGDLVEVDAEKGVVRKVE